MTHLYVYRRVREMMIPLCFTLLSIFTLHSAKAQNPAQINFDQVKNGKGAQAGTIIEFIGSELGPNNSTYSEGMSVPQRVQLSEIVATPNDEHVLSFKHQIYDPTKDAFAYDFLTSWQQAVTNGNGLLNNLMNFKSSLGNQTDVAVDDSYFSSNPVSGQDIAARTAAYELASGARTASLYGNDVITTASLTLTGVENVNGNLYALYDLKWTSKATAVDFEFAGHLAVTDGTVLGASHVEGASNHIKLEGIDGGGINSRDNQIRLNADQCSIINAVASSNTPVCEGATLHLYAEAVTGAAYLWTGPNNFTSTDQNPSIDNVTTAANGTYTVEVTVGGCSNSASTDVVINPKPMANPTSKTLCADNAGGSTATFNLSMLANDIIGNQTGVSVSWFSSYNAATKTLSNPITPNASGNYSSANATIYAQVSNNATGCLSDVVAVTLAVNPLPTITIGSNPAVCYGAKTASLSYSAVSNNPVTYSLTFDATALAAGFTNIVNAVLPASPISITIPSSAAAGITYNATLTVSNGTCTSEAYPITIKINPLPPCTITRTDVPSSTTSSVGATASFSGPAAPSGTTYTYVWSITNNTSGASFVGGINNTKTVGVKTTTVGTYTVTLVVTNQGTGCSSTPACSYAVTVTPIGPSVTYTQGFYGNSGGKACNGQYSYQIMLNAVNAAGGSVRFGNQNPTDSRSFTLVTADVNNTTKSNIYKMLPGGSTPYVLKPAYTAACPYYTASFAKTCTYPAVPMSSTGSINNVLLAQTMSLFFNVSYSNAVSKPVGGLVLTGNVLKFAKPSTACGSTYVAQATSSTIPCSVFKYLANAANYANGATISNLLDLANKVLGGVVPTTTISASDMNTALDIINKGFDGGGQIVAVSTSCTGLASQSVNDKVTLKEETATVTQLTVSTSPNPFNEKIRFVLQSPVSGHANLEVYNLLGQKVQTVYQGYLSAGRSQTVDYNVPAYFRTSLIYRLSVGNHQVTGKLINVK